MIKQQEYAKRRKQLMQHIGSEGIAILPAATEATRNNDATYAYRQHSDFFYLTGFNEPDAVLVLAPKRKGGEYILFNRVRDRAREIWDGPRAGQEGARETFLANEAYPISELTNLLPELLAGRDKIYYPFGQQAQFDRLIMDAINQGRAKVRSGLRFPTALADLSTQLHEMRLFKSKAELAIMQKAVDITAKGHIAAMRACSPGKHEYELEAALTHEFMRHGARFQAYNAIVGAGKNSCILHYIANDQPILNGDLVLIDAGAEVDNYAADITRTFPANGRFSGEQKAIYELVLESQLAAIKSIKPGASWTSAQQVIVKVLTQGLVDLKILKGNVDNLIEKQAYFPFYMHRSGHWLGLDVHDVGSYRKQEQWRKLEPNMVLTVEPGLYISADIKGVPARWHNIGVRIEDDVVVTESGREVLSSMIPKTVSDIEALMAG